MKKKEYIVVGGGIAGLTAAVYLSKEKKDVLLIEKNEKCGGLMNSFERDGFHFEGGARALVNSGLVIPMKEELGLNINFLKNQISVGIENEIFKIEGEESLLDYEKLLKKLYPQSVAEINVLIDEIKKVINDLKVLYGADNPLFSKTKKDITMIPSVFKWLIKFFHTIYRINKLNIPMEKYLSKIIANNSLFDVFSQHFFKGTPAFFSLSYFALYNDYIYPENGVGGFTQKICEKIKEYGSEVLTNTSIVKVYAREKIIEDINGNQYQYEKLIWAADLKKLYSIIDFEDLPAKYKNKFIKEKDLILSSKGAESVFTLFAAVNEPVSTFSNITSAHLFYTPSKQGLGNTHRQRLKDILSNWDNINKDKIFSWLDDFIKLNTFEVSMPALRNPKLAPEGKTGIIISFLADFDLFEIIKKDGWYGEFKNKIEDKVIEVFSSTIFPFLKEKLIFKFSASPITLFERVDSSEGSIVGWSFENKIPTVDNMMKMNDSVKTSIPSIFKVGKWAYSPAGGPTAIMTGRLAAKLALK